MQCENKLITQIDKIMYFDFFIDDYFFLKKRKRLKNFIFLNNFRNTQKRKEKLK